MSKPMIVVGSGVVHSVHTSIVHPTRLNSCPFRALLANVSTSSFRAWLRSVWFKKPTGVTSSGSHPAPMKFRVPSSSLASTAFETPQDIPVQPAKPKNVQPTKPKKSKKPHVTSRRTRAHKLDKAKAAVKVAAKRAQKTKQLVEPSIAYVGNIGPDVDEKVLVAHFSRYGKILSARIHCCGGVAMTVKPPPASYHENKKVRQYAILVFETKSARHKACKQESVLNGRKLVVSVVVSDLPEVQEKVVKRLEDYRSRMEPADVRRAEKSALKSLKLEPTVLLDVRHEKERKERRKRMQWLGVSLAEGIM
ncbi:hypothetical protein V8E55_001827 [Tylopilus felleus]